MTKIKQLLKKQWFTLVELIIVIAIIAVLAVAAFMMLTKWLGKSRDSRRLWDLWTIKKALEITYSDTDNQINQYPDPTNWTGVEDGGGNDMWKLWVFGIDTIAEMDNMQKTPQDPSDKSLYKYATTLNNKEFQVGTILEDGSEVSILWNVMAGSRQAKLDGNYDGYVNYMSGGTNGNRVIVRTPSLLLHEWNSVWDLSGANEMFMVEGKDLWTEMVVRSYEVVGDSPDLQEVADGLGIDIGMVGVVLKKESGVVVESGGWDDGWWSSSNGNDANTVFLMHGDSNISDESGESHPITTVWAANFSNTKEQFGWGSMYFGGAGNYLTVADTNNNFDFGTDDFTIDFWADADGSDRFAFGYGDYDRGNTIIIRVRNTAAQTRIMWEWVAGEWKFNQVVGLSDGFHHIALEKKANKIYFYVDGVSIGNLDDTTNYVVDTRDYTTDCGIYIWSLSSTTTCTPNAAYKYSWYIDEVRISKGIARTTDSDDYMYGDWDCTELWQCFIVPAQPYGN